MSSGRGISKQHLAPLLSLAVQRTAELQQPPVRIMAVQVTCVTVLLIVMMFRC
jgi:hypothetical protein